MAKFLVTKKEIESITNLNGYRLYVHQMRKKYLIELIKKRLPSESSILDVGCGIGDVAVELSADGYDVHGIDFEKIRLNRAKRLAAKHKQIINFKNKSFEELSSSNKCDIVLLGEVLEHFGNPVDVLRKLRLILRPNGRVVISAPNMPSLRNRIKFGIFGIFPDNNPEHKYYLDYTRLSKVICSADYQLDYFKTKFTHIQCKSGIMTCLKIIFLSWFSLLFPKSGHTIFAMISLI